MSATTTTPTTPTHNKNGFKTWIAVIGVLLILIIWMLSRPASSSKTKSHSISDRNVYLSDLVLSSDYLGKIVHLTNLETEEPDHASLIIKQGLRFTWLAESNDKGTGREIHLKCVDTDEEFIIKGDKVVDDKTIPTNIHFQYKVWSPDGAQLEFYDIKTY
jgi:hypothetical protein